jgi:hypothetical protein
MALNTNPFVEGIDPTSTFGGYASVLLQLIRQAQPSSTYGMILFDTTAPDVTGANAWRKRCIWIDLTVPGTPTVNVYKEGGSPGWANVQALIPPLTVKNSMISNPNPLDADKGISITKFAPNGGTANQLIRVNGTATAFEFVSLASLVTVGSIPVGSLITTGIPAGQLRFAGVVGPGTATWYDAQQIINALSNAAIGTDLIAPAPVTSTRSKLLTTRTADTFATWRYFEPNVDILNDTMNGSKLQAGTVGPERIYSTGVPDGYLLSKVAGVPDWIPAPTANYVNKYASTATALPTTGNIITPLNHGLGGQPINVYGVLVCDSPEHNYVKYDEVPLDQIYTSAAGGEKPTFNFHATTTQIHCVRTNSAGLLLANATTGVQTTLTDANWLIKFYAIK